MDQEQLFIEAALQGDQDAFSQIVSLYQARVYNLAFRMLGDAYEAEDAALECFVRIFRKLHQYDHSRKFSTWVLSIASNYCIDQIRRRRLAWLSLDDELLPPGALASHAPGPEDSYIQREREAEISAMLDKLSGKYRAAVILHYWYDMSYEEIAETTGESVGAIKSRLFRARQMLAGHLQQSAGSLALAPA